MSELEPNIEVIADLASWEVQGKLALVLMYRYHDSDGSYTEWLDGAMASLAEVGGKVVWSATGGWPIVGSTARWWDVISIIEYPSREAFLSQIQSGAFAAVERFRMTAMVSNEIYACFPVVDAIDRD